MQRRAPAIEDLALGDVPVRVLVARLTFTDATLVDLLRAALDLLAQSLGAQHPDVLIHGARHLRWQLAIVLPFRLLVHPYSLSQTRPNGHNYIATSDGNPVIRNTLSRWRFSPTNRIPLVRSRR